MHSCQKKFQGEGELRTIDGNEALNFIIPVLPYISLFNLEIVTIETTY